MVEMLKEMVVFGGDKGRDGGGGVWWLEVEEMVEMGVMVKMMEMREILEKRVRG